MLNLIKNIFKTNLFKVTSLNSVSVLVRIAGGLLASVMTARFLGPSGMALTGNLRNFLTSVDTFSILGFQNGIIKYTAENAAEEQRLFRTLGTVFISILITILLFSVALFFPALLWSKWILKTEEYAWVFRVLALSLPWYTGNLIFIAVLNGLGKYRQVVSINIWGNIVGVLLSALLIWKFGVPGAFLGLILYPSIMFFLSFYLLYRIFPRLPFLRWKHFDRKVLKGLFSYSGMALISALLGPVIYLSIRNNLIEVFGDHEAGYWEAMNRISSFYLLFVSTLLTLYFLPGLSQAKTPTETRSVFRSYYRGIVPVFAFGLIVIYFLKNFIIRTVLSDEFLPMQNLFIWQLSGDFLKVCSLILGYELLAKKHIKIFIITEIMSFAILYVSASYFASLYASEGAVMAHLLTYSVYLAVLAGYFRKQLFLIS
ncbi:O-antigen translocase [Flavobacterium sp. MFBS3-15]|uniref:O-antigen translocase n=1 Tax=Flavobacterium sp. MFBS3-15 TaxID=2989816 RepID=UPI002236AF55|nr:O-antigen translocase [Flavobacterium sp. MFBS3-15]MCW4468405.1 O-antigen translocase [Flavobacterium sp. MFBS3-15]